MTIRNQRLILVRLTTFFLLTSILYVGMFRLGINLQLEKLESLLLGRGLAFFLNRIGWEVGLFFLSILLALLNLEGVPAGAPAPDLDGVGGCKGKGEVGPLEGGGSFSTINQMEASGSSNGSNRSESKMGGGSSRGSGWTSFDLDVLSEPFPDTESEAVSQPNIPGYDAGITDEERRRFSELFASREYKSVEKNANKCEEQVRLIVDKARQVLANRGIEIRDPQDIRRGVDIYLTEIWDREPTARLKTLKRILSTGDNSNSGIWTKIINEITKL